MTAENTPRCGVGRAAIYLLIAVVIVAGIALLCLNEGALIDSMPFYVNIPVVLGIFAVLLLIAIFLWVQAHRIYAVGKGYSSLFGLVLGFVPVIGLLVIASLPGKGIAPAGEAPAEAEQPSEKASQA